MAAADRAQDLVAGRVAVGVVEDLELVDVDHQDPDGVAGPAAAGEQRRRTRRNSAGSAGRSGHRSRPGPRRRDASRPARAPPMPRRRRRRGSAGSRPTMARPIRRESTIAPTTTVARRSAARPGSRRSEAVRRSATRSAGDRGRRPPARGAATGPTATPSGADPRGRRSAAASCGSGCPGGRSRAAPRGRVRLGPPTDHDDVVGAGRLAQLLDDGIDDGIGRDRARQAGQDAGERLRLAPPAASRPGDRRGVDDGADAGHDDEPRGRTTSRAASGRRGRAEQPRGRAGGMRRRRATRTGGCVDPTDPRARGARVGWLTSGIQDGGPGPSRPLPGTRYRWRRRPGTSVPVARSGGGVVPAAAASWPPPRLTW